MQMHMSVARAKMFLETGYELVLHFTLFAGRGMPIWIKVQDNQPAHPFDFNSPEVALQKPEVIRPQTFVTSFNTWKAQKKSSTLDIPKQGLQPWCVWGFIGVWWGALRLARPYRKQITQCGC